MKYTAKKRSSGWDVKNAAQFVELGREKNLQAPGITKRYLGGTNQLHMLCHSRKL